MEWPRRGALTGDGDDRTYIPDSGFFGNDLFTWKVHDGLNDSNVATVLIIVDQSIDPPSLNTPAEVKNIFRPGDLIRVWCNGGVEILTPKGELVQSLSCPEDPSATVIYWDGTNGAGEKASSGVYLYRMKNDPAKKVYKLVILR